AYPLALGRRSCPPTHPVNLGLRTGTLHDALTNEPWQIPPRARKLWGHQHRNAAHIDLPATLDDPTGDDVREDVPLTYAPKKRAFANRRVRHTYLRVATGLTPDPKAPPTEDDGHDPFALLGW
ncbi:type I-E CRISPR-associated protein Cas5/CasD, partial [Streptomyces durbertensis]